MGRALVSCLIGVWASFRVVSGQSTVSFRLRPGALLALAGWLCWPGHPLAETSPTAREAAPRYVVGLSPFLPRDVKDDLYRQIVGFLLEDLPLTSSLWICDAYHLQTVTRVDIPEVSAFRSAKTRANQFKEPIRRLKEFLAAEPERTVGAVAAPPQALRFPQFLDFVGENLGGARRRTVVLVFGSPVYVDAKEPNFSMVDGYFPSDGHLLVSRERSVFGLEGRTNRLAEVEVHYGWFGDPWVSEVHRDRVQRFWSLFLQGQGARLATFCGDLATVFRLARPAALVADPHPARLELDATQSKIEMLRITRTVGAQDWITRDALSPVRPPPPTNTVGVMKIGIRWQGNLDLDLYARPTREGETLFFDHKRSPEGYYFKDHRTSPEREYEFIEFETPVDVWKAEASVNFYAGSAPRGVSGEVRIEFENKIYSGRFSLEADHGNQGRSGRNQALFWTVVNIPSLLGLAADEGVSQ